MKAIGVRAEQQAGHMGATDQLFMTMRKTLLTGCRPHMGCHVGQFDRLEDAGSTSTKLHRTVTF
jgi:hypothetical protein